MIGTIFGIFFLVWIIVAVIFWIKAAQAASKAEIAFNSRAAEVVNNINQQAEINVQPQQNEPVIYRDPNSQPQMILMSKLWGHQSLDQGMQPTPMMYMEPNQNPQYNMNGPDMQPSMGIPITPANLPQEPIAQGMFPSINV